MLILVQIMDIIKLVQVVGLYTELYTSANYVVWERIVSEGDASQEISGTDQDNNGGVRWIDDTLDILAGKQWFTTLDLVIRYWQVS